jgi:glyoxylate reductase
MSDRPRVYVTRRLPRPAIELLGQHVQTVIWPGDLPPPRAVLLKEVAQIDGLLALLTDRVDATLLDAAPQLRVISNYAVACDNIDLKAATKRRIMVANTPDVLTETTADFTMALMLAAARRVIESEQFVKAGRWRTWGPETLLGRDIYGATLGLIGLGRVGQAVARRAAGFGMRVHYYSPRRKLDIERAYGVTYASLEELLSHSDVISLHCPLNDETYHLIDRDALELLRPSAILVNTASGQLVDTRALLDTLQAKPIIAALDVTDPEPLPSDHPLLGLANAVVTPHVASASLHTRTRMALMAVENLLAGLRGERPQFLVNSEVFEDRVISVGAS